MSKKLKMGLLTCALAAISTIAIAQSFTTFPQARIINQLDLQGTVTANGVVGTAGQALVSGGPGVDVTWASVTSPPGGVNTQVQYNDGGVFGGDAGLTFDEAADRLTMGFGTITGARTNAAAPLLLSSTTTSVRWNETDGALDNKQWEWAANGEQFRLGLLDDTGVLGGTAFLIDRTGTVVDLVTLPGSALTVTGAATFNSNATVSKADPRLCLYDSGSDATTFFRNSGDIFSLRMVDGSVCTTTGAANPLSITATAGTASLMSLLVESLTVTDSGTLPSIAVNGAATAWNFGGEGLNEGFMALQRYNVALGGPDFVLSHSRSGTTGGNTIVAANDELGSISFMGANGTGYDKGARILAFVDGTPGASADMPGRLVFQTTSDASASPTTRVTIDSLGKMTTQATATTSAGFNLPHGTAPSAPVNGDLWTTTGGLFMRQNGTTRNYVDTSSTQSIGGSKTFTAATQFDNGIRSTNGFTNVGRFGMSVQNPTSLSANTNDWGLNAHPIVVITASASVNVTGIQASTTNDADPNLLGGSIIMYLVNTSAQTITLTHQDALSAAENRFILPNGQSLALAPDTSIGIYYDVTALRWRTRTAPTNPGGSSTQFQFNEAGKLSGSPLLTRQSATELRLNTLATGDIVKLGFDDFFGDGALHLQLDAVDGVHHRATWTAGTAIEMQDTLATTSGTLNNANLQTPFWRLSGASALTLTGIVPTADGQIIKIYNGKTANLTITDEGAGSTAENRFALPNDTLSMVVLPGEAIEVWYDTTLNRWVVVGGDVTVKYAFTLNFTVACTTTPTMLMSAARVGTMVSMRVNGTMSSCTSDSTSFSTTADVPADIRPDANSCFSVNSGASDNGLAVGALFCIQSDGTVVIQECPTPGVAGFGCSASTWTASGTKFLGGFQQVFTYNIDQTP